MGNQIEPDNAEMESLERQKDILRKGKPFFESYGFYMPDFEKTIDSLSSAQQAKNAVSALYIGQGRGDGTTTLRDAALRTFQGWKMGIIAQAFSDSEFPPDAEKIIKNELLNARKKRFHPLPPKQQAQADADPTRKFPRRFSKGYSIGTYSSDVVKGYMLTLQEYFFVEAQTHLIGGGFKTVVFTEGGDVLLNPQILLDSRIQQPFEALKEIVSSYLAARKEIFLKKVKKLLKAGKNFTEIRAELMPEGVAIGNGVPPRKSGAEITSEPTDAAPANDTLIEKGRRLRTNEEIALLFHYERKAITQIQAAELLDGTDKNSTEKLIKTYNTIRDKKEEIISNGTLQLRRNLLKRIKEVQLIIPENERLKKDVEALLAKIDPE